MKKKLIAAAVGLMMLFGMSACSATPTAAPTGSADASATASPDAPAAAEGSDRLVVDLVAEPVSLDPAQVSDINTYRVHYLMYDTLIT
ncbi:MAG: hypothetical protein PHD32_01620 [Eubacteriales bacterium]|nr:hypothetical protein [Eubacteriales bacterium]